jgi:hypothetical protein
MKWYTDSNCEVFLTNSTIASLSICLAPFRLLSFRFGFSFSCVLFTSVVSAQCTLEWSLALIGKLWIVHLRNFHQSDNILVPLNWHVHLCFRAMRDHSIISLSCGANGFGSNVGIIIDLWIRLNFVTFPLIGAGFDELCWLDAYLVKIRFF